MLRLRSSLPKKKPSSLIDTTAKGAITAIGIHHDTSSSRRFFLANLCFQNRQCLVKTKCCITTDAMRAL